MSTKEEIAEAAMSVFAPFVGLFVEMGLTSDDAERLLRRVYVRQAREHELKRSGGKRVSDARLAMICGVPRKAVSEILSSAEFQPNVARHRASWLLHVWRTESRFTNADGTPRALPFEAAAKGGPSFMELATTYAANVWPNTLLAELLRTEAVRQDERGLIHIYKDAYAAPATKVSALRELATTAKRLQGTLVHNLTATAASKRPVRTISSERVSATDARRLRRQFQSSIDAMARALEANVRAAALEAPANEGEAVRLGVSVFLFEESESGAAETVTRTARRA